MKYKNTKKFAQEMDASDSLRKYRDMFIFPKHNETNCLYYTGNSLGLQPTTVAPAINNELNEWGRLGVEGYFRPNDPWISYQEKIAEKMATIVGAEKEEVAISHSLTTNLHLLMVSFYGPTPTRYKILCESKAFPSDLYALQSQALIHGYNPEDAIIEVAPREGEHTIRTEDIIKAIEQNSDELALVMMGGVNYYSGQVLLLLSSQ